MLEGRSAALQGYLMRLEALSLIVIAVYIMDISLHGLDHVPCPSPFHFLLQMRMLYSLKCNLLYVRYCLFFALHKRFPCGFAGV